ncbi:chloroplast outer envelope protein 37 [Actinidia rufa]|uniref:Chloroplast outer envelope protein 37 n=1 Tax=Actinidia rufa TaxID=165716 RepID=A0A7J0E8K8_9ERIC|nr:chloroplast outer envelope protein 37 [Actinidia rufa]
MAQTTVESVPPNPNYVIVPATAGDPPPPQPNRCCSGRFYRRPGLRVTTEFDSDSSTFFHKISCKLLDSLAKLKVSFQNNDKGEISDPQLAFTSKYLSLHYDFEDQNAVVSSSFDLGPALHFKTAQNIKAQQGEVAMVADLAGPAYKFELSSSVPSLGLPKATLKLPLGEISLEDKVEEQEEATRMLSINGIVKGHLLNGVCTAQYQDENLNLRYLYKDEQMAFIPSISLPSNALSFAFKRQFDPSNKLRSESFSGVVLVEDGLWGTQRMGIQKANLLHIWDGFRVSSFQAGWSPYWYNFDSNYWSTVYKHTVGKDYKFKVGYDSEVRLGWASIWVCAISFT